MSILDWIKSILGNGKKNAKFYTKTLKKPIGDNTPLEIGLYDGNTPITGEEIGIQINNGKQYIKTTDNDGIARLNINLGVGEYTAKIYWKGNNEFNNLTAYNEIFITTDTYIDGINLNKTVGDTTPYQCAVYRMDNNTRIKDEVTLTINGKSYTRKADDDGLYKLNINLNTGTYNIEAKYQGNNIYNPSITNNTITIEEKPPEPQPTPEPQESRHVKILNYFENHFGECQYIDEALEAIQGKGYSFYFSDGYNMYETIDNVANGNGANCYDIAEVLYHLARGMNEKYGRDYEVQYLDVWCPVDQYDHIRLRLRNGPNGDWWYRDGACVLSGGDITSNWCGTSDNILEVNPSFIYDGD